MQHDKARTALRTSLTNSGSGDLEEKYVGIANKEFRELQSDNPRARHYGELLRAYPSATTYENLPKNRYQDILPKESTRVHLPAEAGSDFINANFVDGTVKKEFIACQAPLPSTFRHFWMMVAAQSVSMILMLTNLVEKGRRKAHAYFPSSPGEYYTTEGISVSLQRTLEYSEDIAIRLFTLKTFSGSRRTSERTVVQIHYRGWPDSGCPPSPTALRELIGLYETLQPSSHRTGPTIVHCSAGVGRTGTFIAAKIAADLIRAKKSVNIKRIVSSLRRSRDQMVQRKEQYQFLFATVLDSFRDRKPPAAFVDSARLRSLLGPAEPLGLAGRASASRRWDGLVGVATA